MTIELKAANAELAVTQEDDILRVEISAGGIDPVGVVKPAVQDSIGLAPTLRFNTGVESIAGMTAAIPDKADRTKDVACRIGWGATVNSGNVDWELRYQWVGLDDLLDAAQDGAVNVVSAVSVAVNGYVFTSFTIPAPSATDRILRAQIARRGDQGTDTCTGDAHVVGILFDYIAGV